MTTTTMEPTWIRKAENVEDFAAGVEYVADEGRMADMNKLSPTECNDLLGLAHKLFAIEVHEHAPGWFPTPEFTTAPAQRIEKMIREADVSYLNPIGHVLRERWTLAQAEIAEKLASEHTGGRVRFWHNPSETQIEGTLVRANAKTVIVDDDDGKTQWRVTADMVEAV